MKLTIYSKTGNERCITEKWKFSDGMMKEQYVMCTVRSATPIPFVIGDWCEFRGERYVLTYIPSAKQSAKSNSSLDAYQYVDIKFSSLGDDELSRCIVLDITSTTSDWKESLGTNYTGSSVFSLFCGGISVVISGQTVYRPSVCVLMAKLQANLDRMYGTGTDKWNIHINVENIKTEDKVVSFNNTSVLVAMSEVYNTFGLNYCIRGRDIYIGYDMADVWGELADFNFGYGKGFPVSGSDGKGLFEIERTADSSQQVVTRLRVFGSSKNIPYRYYNKKYNLSQSLFPSQLQLPDTFLPYGDEDTPGTKAYNNAHSRAGKGLNDVLGGTNDSYIDKDNDASNSDEGIREASIRFDGSDSELDEIYPTIEGGTYAELREAGITDAEGEDFPNYTDNERIDQLLFVDSDANIGDGILSEDEYKKSISENAGVSKQYYRLCPSEAQDDFTQEGSNYIGRKINLFTINDIRTGVYSLMPLNGTIQMNAWCHNGMQPGTYKQVDSFFVKGRITVTVIAKNGLIRETARSLTPDDVYISSFAGNYVLEMPSLENLTVYPDSHISVDFEPIIHDITWHEGRTGAFTFGWNIDSTAPYIPVEYYVEPMYSLIPSDDTLEQNKQFHVFIKDMGFDLEACFNNDTPTVSMKSGECVGREFTIGNDIERVTDESTGKKGYRLTLNRAIDNSLNTYYPNGIEGGGQLKAGDEFVLIGIDMPSVFIDMAEERLLSAATEWLATNSKTKFTYQPRIDNIYIQRDYDKCLAENREGDSVLYRLYAGLKFSFYTIPDSDTDTRTAVSVLIEQVSITMGDSLVPNIEIKLNDNIQAGILQKITNAIDKISNSNTNNITSITANNQIASDITASNTGHADTFAVEGVTLNASTLSHCRYVITFTQAPGDTDVYGRVNLTIGGFKLPIVYEGGYASLSNKWQAGDTMDVWYQSGAWHLQRANYPHLSYEVWGTIEKISNPYNRN